jgi:hypothetical protein
MKFLPLTALVLSLAPAALATVEAKCLIVENHDRTGYNVKEIIYPYDFYGPAEMLREQYYSCAGSITGWKAKVALCDATAADMAEELRNVSFCLVLFCGSGDWMRVLLDLVSWVLLTGWL